MKARKTIFYTQVVTIPILIVLSIPLIFFLVGIPLIVSLVANYIMFERALKVSGTKKPKKAGNLQTYISNVLLLIINCVIILLLYVNLLSEPGLGSGVNFYAAFILTGLFAYLSIRLYIAGSELKKKGRLL